MKRKEPNTIKDQIKSTRRELNILFLLEQRITMVDG